MLILRLKRCERALVGGRLDEAASLLQAADARAHRRGQELIDRLVAALVKRGRAHLAANRLAAAEADCHAAARLAGNLPELSDLRTEIDRAADAGRLDANHRRQANAVVAELVRKGQLTLAAEAAHVEPIASDERNGAMIADLAVRRAAAERLETDVAAALDAGDWEAAVQHLAGAGSLVSRGGRILRLTRKVGQQVAAEVSRCVQSGRMDLAEGVMRRAHGLCAAHADLDAQRRGLEQCRAAWDALANSRFHDARAILDRLATLWPAAQWIPAAIAELRTAGESVEALRGGPLGALSFGQTTIAYTSPKSEPRLLAACGFAPPPATPVAHAVLTPPRIATSLRRFLLHVDGAGSFVILQGDRVDVGPISASRPPDLALVTGAGAPSFTISRSDEDYFVTAGTPLDVNDRGVTSKLLVTGDRIGVGPRCRIEFRRPNAASSSAVLRVSGARLPWGGVREAILMDREIVLGASPAAHVRVRDGLNGAVILQAASDGLVCRAQEEIIIDGQPSGRTTRISDGARVAVGPLSFVVCRE